MVNVYHNQNYQSSLIEIITYIILIRIFVIGSLIRPKVVRSVHYCEVTKTVLERAYSDLTSLSAFPHSAIYPTTVITLYK